MRLKDGQLETQVSVVPQQGGRSLAKPFLGFTSTLHPFPDNQTSMLSSFLTRSRQRTASLAESHLPCSWEWLFR